MILLCDNDAKVYTELYHVSDEGVITAVRYSHGQVQLAKEYLPRGEPLWKFTPVLSWRYIPESGVIRYVEKHQLPKPLQLYLMLLED